MQVDPHDFPAWLSEKDQETWQSARPAVTSAWSECYGEHDNFEKYESHLQFGHRAAIHFDHPHWDEKLETELKPAWKGDWNADKVYIRRGWELTRTRPGLVAKPFESLPETSRSQPAISNELSEANLEISPGL